VAFTVKKKKLVSLESPEALFNDLRGRRKIEGLLAHQADVLRAYVEQGLKEPDVALQLPTGSGKTLVGLLLGEWRRLKNGERVVYLCPTNQLVNQVAEQARNKYGIDVIPFTGPKAEYDQSAKAAYLGSESIAITSYSSLFNTNPFFSSNHLIILDDAHAAENYISNAWSLSVNRRLPQHAAIFAALTNVLRQVLSPVTFRNLTAAQAETRWDESWVDSIPLPSFEPLISEITGILDAHTSQAGDLVFPWRWLKGHLDACHIYLARGEILVRPLIPPTNTHSPFASASQRLYMSATLGSGGDLERITGRSGIMRLPVPVTWETQGVGRRLFFFPSSSLTSDEISSLVTDMVKVAGRAVILTTGMDQAQDITEMISDRIGFPVFGAKEIEGSKKAFIESDTAVAVIANRFDGIDFPGDECRLLVIDQLPQATNLQERFFSSRVGANILLNDRIMTRVVQGFGRCTRGATDFAAVVVTGESLFSYLIPKEKRGFFHPELQAEIEFGLVQSREKGEAEFLENLQIFLGRGPDWQDADASIVELRHGKTQVQLPGTEDLRAAVNHEVAYQYALWSGRYADALDAARSVLGLLRDDSLRSYRALWNYFAGNAAWLAHKHGGFSASSVATDYYRTAQKAVGTTRWLMELAKFAPLGEKLDKPSYLPASFSVIERLERQIEDQGVATNFKFDQAEAQILGRLNSKDEKEFELGHEQLGQMLGYDAHKIEVDASPDPWWQADESFCFVFEDHSGAKKTGIIDAKKARQAATHGNWIREHVPLNADAQVVTVMLTSVTKAKIGAVPHIKTLIVWPLEDFKQWAVEALGAIRDLRKSFSGPGDVEWKASALDRYRKLGISPDALRDRLTLISSSIKWTTVK
jgi:hypothetical protein